MDETDLSEGVYKGYIEGLGDPYSVYYDEEETKQMSESLSGEFGGVGALMSQDRETGVITVLQVYDALLPGGRHAGRRHPLQGGGRRGDRRGPVRCGEQSQGGEGNQVTLTVLRADTGDEEELTITRDTIEAQTVSHEMKENNVGYIRITEFDTVTYEQYKEALEDLEDQGMERLIVDLRSNPGGNLDTVCDILDLMLPEGLIVYTEDKNGEREEYTSDEEISSTNPWLS